MNPITDVFGVVLSEIPGINTDVMTVIVALLTILLVVLGFEVIKRMMLGSDLEQDKKEVIEKDSFGGFDKS